MRRKLAASAAIVLSAALVAATPANAKGKDPAQKLADAVTVSGILQHARQFQVIANRNGGTRASGLPGYDASADYVARTLRQSGYTVRKQTFTFPFFRDVEPASLTQLTPDAQELETASFTYSGSGDVTGVVVPTNDVLIPPLPAPGSTSGCEGSDFAPAPAGPSIALIQRGTCTFEVKADNAAAAGYDAVIIFNEGQAGRTELLTGTLGVPKSIPVVGLSFEDGAALYADTQAGATTAQVVTNTESDPNRETVNVIADLPSTSRPKNPDEVVVVGAHLDSVVEGPGINDNGSGSATILEIAQEMAENKMIKRPNRPVRFAFWGAEELGLLGSEHYVSTLPDRQLARIYANLNFDMLGSPNYVRFVYDGDGSAGGPTGPAGSDTIESIFTDYFDSKGLASEPTAFDGRSDYGPFIAAGIPAGGLFSGAEGVKTPEQAAIYGGTAGVAYDSCYHQACDTITNVSAKALFELGDAAAAATAVLTQTGIGLYPDGSRTAQRQKAVELPQRGHSATR